jgi:magnesium transporter
LADYLALKNQQKMSPMRIFHVHGTQVSESAQLPEQLPAQGFVWISCARPAFEAAQGEIQEVLQNLCGMALVDLHVSDLLNPQLPSAFDSTSQYDLLVFRRLARSAPQAEAAPLRAPVKRSGPSILRRIDTSPVGFAIFDRVLLTVHPSDCAVRDAYASRLLTAGQADARSPVLTTPNAANSPDGRSTGARGVPASPADMMLRIVSQMVDGFLELRRELSHQLDHWQTELLSPRSRFNNWAALLEARLSLHQLDEICEDQRASVQEWIDALASWPNAVSAPDERERELLRVRSRDVLEHIERVVSHVHRLEHNAEAAVQMHFSAQGHRTNDIMRTLTALTAIFLPLNLIAGIFGMNFEFIPFLHLQNGFWWALGAMVSIATLLGALFWRKRYLARTGSP